MGSDAGVAQQQACRATQTHLPLGGRVHCQVVLQQLTPRALDAAHQPGDDGVHSVCDCKEGRACMTCCESAPTSRKGRPATLVETQLNVESWRIGGRRRQQRCSATLLLRPLTAHVPRPHAEHFGCHAGGQAHASRAAPPAQQPPFLATHPRPCSKEPRRVGQPRLQFEARISAMFA